MHPLKGNSADPQFRRDRARKAALARTSLDHHVDRLVAAAPELTPAQRARLSALLRPADHPQRGEAA